MLLATLSFSLWDTLKSTSRDQQKLVVLDECWKLLQDDGAAQIVAELFRTGRKWGASTFAITQSLQDFKSSPIHHAVLSNASRMLLLQHASGHADVASFLVLRAHCAGGGALQDAAGEEGRARRDAARRARAPRGCLRGVGAALPAECVRAVVEHDGPSGHGAEGPGHAGTRVLVCGGGVVAGAEVPAGGREWGGVERFEPPCCHLTDSRGPHEGLNGFRSLEQSCCRLQSVPPRAA